MLKTKGDEDDWFTIPGQFMFGLGSYSYTPSGDNPDYKKKKQIGFIRQEDIPKKQKTSKTKKRYKSS